MIHLEGDPYERGLQYGRLMSEEISHILEAWKAELPAPLNEYPEEIIQSYMNYVDEMTPALLQEVRGIADGSGVSFEELFAFQVGEELDNIDPGIAKHCTSISTNKPLNSPVIVAQNMDPPLFLHGYPLILHITEENMESFIYTSPGLIGLNGMNSKGIAIACNSMSMLNNKPSGLPVSFILRESLAKESFGEVIDFLGRVDHSTPQTYTVGGMDTTVCLECSPAGCFPFSAFEDEGITLHTNYAIANRDFSDQFIEFLAEYGKTVEDPYFCPRYFLAYDLIVEKDFILDPAAIMEILSSRESDLEPISNMYTYGSSVMVLGDRPSLYIAPGRPDTTGYLHLQFDQFKNNLEQVILHGQVQP